MLIVDVPPPRGGSVGTRQADRAQLGMAQLSSESRTAPSCHGDSGRPGTQEMVREVAKALGVKSVRELDI
jgi:hypothetical protein